MAKTIKNSSTRMFGAFVNKFLGDFPDLTYNGKEVECLVCDKPLLCWNRQMCRRHINSEGHKHKKKGQQGYSEFIVALVFTLSACNIPFVILDKRTFREFWKQFIPEWKLPTRNTLLGYLPVVRVRIENEIKSKIQNKKLWLTVDKTTDSKNSIITVIVRTLSPLEPSPPYLVTCERLLYCTAKVVTNLVVTTLHNFEVLPDQVLIFVSDGSPFMLSMGCLLKKVFPDLLHITCLLHGLHFVAGSIRKCYPDVDTLIVQTKAVFLKSKRIWEFHKHCPGIPEPPQPIVTRCDTWLQSAFYYYQHFQQIKSLVLQFNPKEAAAIMESQVKLQDAQVEADLKTIHDNYVPLADAIQKLQNTSLSLVDSLKIVDDAHKVVQTLNNDQNICVRKKFDNILSKNVGFTKLKEVYSNSVPTDPLTPFLDHLNYTNITSLDAERSSLVYKDIFSLHKTQLKKKTVENFVMLQMYGQIHPDFS